MDGLARHLRACRACSALEARAVRARGVLVLGLQARAAEPAPELLPGLRAKLQVSGSATEVGVDAVERGPSGRGRLPAFPHRRLALVGAAAAAALALWILRPQASVPATPAGPVVVAPVVPAPGSTMPVVASPVATMPVVADGAPAALAPTVRVQPSVALLGASSDGDALRPLRTSEVPLRHAAVRTVEVPWIEGNPGRVLTPGGSVSTVGFGGFPR
jgi:hypothetical protein